ncbi:hypothetical protein [Embleya sp. NPDC020630]|uniref:hypothetical protein n=1 Tax=Embleya sp. NPDC020630 TaxID=3363979 RepID=UPI00379F9610
MAAELRAKFLDERKGLRFAVETADDEVARQASRWTGNDPVYRWDDRVYHPWSPWPREAMVALVRRVLDTRGEALAAFAEAADAPGPLGPAHTGSRGPGCRARIGPPVWRVVRAIGHAPAEGGLSDREVVTPARPASYALRALDSDWMPAIRGQVAAHSRLRELAARDSGGDPDAWAMRPAVGISVGRHGVRAEGTGACRVPSVARLFLTGPERARACGFGCR